MKIGCVPYINSLPLIYGIENEVIKLPPRTLAKLLREDRLDVALAPSVILFDKKNYKVVPNISISSRGEVKSIILFYRDKIEDIKKVAVDLETMSSFVLLKLILRKKYKIDPEYYRSPKIQLKQSPYDAQLLIGDKAMTYNAQCNKLDLGHEWFDLTHLPFIFALWVVRRGADYEKICLKLSQAKVEGLQNIDKVIENINFLPKKVLKNYFAENVNYDLGEDEIEGFKRFNQLLIESNMIQKKVELDYRC